jgi:hypothetical protein
MSVTSSRSIRLVALTLAVGLAAAFAARPARALEFGVRAGALVDDSDPFVGLEVLMPVGQTAWIFNPNLEFVDRGSGDRVSANADFHYDIRRESDFSAWMGAGVAAIHTEAVRGRDARNDAGLDLLAGAGWKLSGVTPYAQLKLVVSNDSAIYAGVGVRF